MVTHTGPPSGTRLIGTLTFKAKYSKKSQIQYTKSHETQNQPNILIKGSITNQCVCLISSATGIPGFCSGSRSISIVFLHLHFNLEKEIKVPTVNFITPLSRVLCTVKVLITLYYRTYYSIT